MLKLIILCFTLELIFLVLLKYDLFFKNNIYKSRKVLRIKHILGEIFKDYGGCFVIIILSLFGFFAILKYNGSKNVDLLGSYCSFLTFVGTFMIGFYIHKKEKDNEKNIRKNRCLRLSVTIGTTYVSMMRLDNIKSQKPQIVYDREWYSYMVEYFELTNTDKVLDMYEALSSFFDCVDNINDELEKKNFEEAIKIRNDYKEKQFYLPIRYNVIDIVNDIDDYKMVSEIGKVERDEFEEKFIRNIFAAQYIKIKDLKECIDEFFDLVELLIYNEVIRKERVDIYLMNKEIIDKLIDNEYLHNKISNKLSDYSARMVSVIVWEISDDIGDKSKKIKKDNKYYYLK